MKNLIKLLVFTFALVLGTTNANAQGLTQDQDRPEVIAKEQTAELNKALTLTGDQERAVFRALVSKEVSYKKQVNGKDLGSASVQSEKKTIDDALNATLKKTLTAEQYKKWLTIKE
jgi:hypothetical protein